MANLGQLSWTVSDTSGTVQTSKTVEVRKQGATVNGAQSTAGAGAFVVTVFDPGGLIASTDSVEVYRAGVLVAAYAAMAVTGATATTLTITAAAAMSLSDLDRLTCTTSLPTCYNDVDGTDAKTNPLTTGSANGTATAYIRGGPYDLKVSGSGLTTTLYPDVWVPANNMLSGELTGPAFIIDTLRTYAAGSKLLSVRNNGTERFYIDGDGSLKAATFDGAVTIASGGLTVSAGGITVAATGITVQAGGLDIEDDATFRDKILIGPSGAADCNIYRTSANVLKTDDSLTVSNTLVSNGYTMFLDAPTVDLTGSGTLTIPGAGTALLCTSTGAATITQITGGTAGQILFLIAKPGTGAMRFDAGGNIVHNCTGGTGPTLDDAAGAGSNTMLIAVMSGTSWYILRAGGNTIA